MSTTVDSRHARKSTTPQGYRYDPPPESGVQSALERAFEHLLGLQKPDGHWVGELQGDTILESESILLLAFLGRETDPRIAKMARYIVSQQRPEGGWGNYPGGPLDISVSVKAYFALKIAGYSLSDPVLVRTRQLILAQGGALHCNSFTKFYMALLGQFPYENCAAVPPEIVFLPRWAYVNLYAMSSWTRTIVVPLSIFWACKPVRELSEEMGIAELFLASPHAQQPPHPPTPRLLSATNFFLAIDRGLKLFERWAPRLIRQAALKKASAWMREHFADSDGVGAIFPPIIYTIVSLRCLGYADDSLEMIYAIKQLDDLMIEEDDTIRVQPCFSPVWDTALSLNALAFVKRAQDENDGTQDSSTFNGLQWAMARAVRWLLKREVRRPGDWTLMNPHLEPAGWCFEYRNGFYPDTDDTAMVLTAMARSGLAFKRGEGLGTRGEAPSFPSSAWERTEPSSAWPDSSLSSIAFANSESAKQSLAHGVPKQSLGTRNGDHPSTNSFNSSPLLPAVERGICWLLGMQNKDGGWAAFDRDINREFLTKIPFADHNAMLDPSCPDITARVLEALGQYGYRVGQDGAHSHVERAIDFIARTQDPRGCWLGRWGVNYIYGTWQVLLGLEAVHFDNQHPIVRNAVAWLKSVQQPSGAWGESCASYADPLMAGKGDPTASQTAWALLGLIAAGEASSEAVRRGIEYLVGTQQFDGTWHEDAFTGTGFPKVFYLKYHMYRLYFPIMALARYMAMKHSEDSSQETEVVRPKRKETARSQVPLGNAMSQALLGRLRRMAAVLSQ